MNKFDLLILATGVLCLNNISYVTSNGDCIHYYFKHDITLIRDLTNTNSSSFTILKTKFKEVEFLVHKCNSLLRLINSFSLKSDLVIKLENGITKKLEKLNTVSELKTKFDSLSHEFYANWDNTISLINEFDSLGPDSDNLSQLNTSKLDSAKVTQNEYSQSLDEIAHNELFDTLDETAEFIENINKEFQEALKENNDIENEVELSRRNDVLLHNLNENGPYFFNWSTRITSYYNHLLSHKNFSYEFYSIMADQYLYKDQRIIGLLNEAYETFDQIAFTFDLLVDKLNQMSSHFNDAQNFNDSALLLFNDYDVIDKDTYLKMEELYTSSINTFNAGFKKFQDSKIDNHLFNVQSSYKKLIGLGEKLYKLCKDIILNEQIGQNKELEKDGELAYHSDQGEISDNDKDGKVSPESPDSKEIPEEDWKLSLKVISILVTITVVMFFGMVAFVYYKRRRELNATTQLII